MGGAIATFLPNAFKNIGLLGDTVNIAARLESFNKEVDGGIHHILISEETHQRLENNFITEFVGKYALKGKKQETEIYRVLSK